MLNKFHFSFIHSTSRKQDYIGFESTLNPPLVITRYQNGALLAQANLGITVLQLAIFKVDIFNSPADEAGHRITREASTDELPLALYQFFLGAPSKRFGCEGVREVNVNQDVLPPELIMIGFDKPPVPVETRRPVTKGHINVNQRPEMLIIHNSRQAQSYP